jgi:hypothetical protein
MSEPTTSRRYIASLFPLMLCMLAASGGAYAMGAPTWPLWGKALYSVGFVVATFVGMCLCMMRAERQASIGTNRYV